MTEKKNPPNALYRITVVKGPLWYEAYVERYKNRGYVRGYTEYFKVCALTHNGAHRRVGKTLRKLADRKVKGDAKRSVSYLNKDGYFLHKGLVENP